MTGTGLDWSIVNNNKRDSAHKGIIYCCCRVEDGAVRRNGRLVLRFESTQCMHIMVQILRTRNFDGQQTDGYEFKQGSRFSSRVSATTTVQYSTGQYKLLAKSHFEFANASIEKGRKGILMQAPIMTARRGAVCG
jgi:hypothetical protein